MSLIVLPQFDAATHRYTVQIQRTKTILPAVTTVLSRGGLRTGVVHNPHLFEALARGRRVHLACERFDRGHTFADAVTCLANEREENYLLSWIRFVEIAKPIWHLIEAARAHLGLHYAGTIDRFGTLCGPSLVGGPIVLDLKTGGPTSWHKYQLAAYLHLIDSPMRLRRATVHLRDDGQIPKIISYNDPTDILEFRRMLAALPIQDGYDEESDGAEFD